MDRSRMKRRDIIIVTACALLVAGAYVGLTLMGIHLVPSEYASHFDRDAPDLIYLFDEDQIAEHDRNEPTFHIRFDQPQPPTE